MYKKACNFIHKFSKKLEDVNNDLDNYNLKNNLKNQELKKHHHEKRTKVANENGFETVEDFDQAIEDLNDEIFGTHSKRK
ncbi:hypothetical protein [Psychrobacter sp. NC44]|uniref:hypothetical protein n=1 Tax=Psychrobacter sp. NC44 TaxID=2774130 RepID=UPI00191B713C|nr:hypothetical protein [Psychrobacter sp. NC44]